MRLIIDSNIFVLLVVGSVDRELIGRHRRLRAYSARDFDILLQFIGEAKSLVLIPQILSEVSNLASSGVSGVTRTQVLDALARIIDAHEERYVPSREAAQRPEYRWLGLADAAALSGDHAQVTIVSDDSLLCAAAWKAGLRAIGFDFLRTVH